MTSKLATTAAIGSIAVLTLAGCSTTDSTDDASGDTASTGIVGTDVITQVYGDGQKITAVAVQYASEIDADSLSTEDFAIEGYEVTDVYTNAEAAIADEAADGNFVIVEVSTDAINAAYALEGDGPGSDTSSEETTTEDSTATEDGAAASSDDAALAEEPSEDSSSAASDDDRPSGERPAELPEGEVPSGEVPSAGMGGGMGSTSTSNELAVTITQTGEVEATDGNVYAASDAIETDYAENTNLGVEDFEQLTYTSTETADELMYNLYTPERYDESESYPIVVFMPDATATGTDPVATLTQGNGATSWATDEAQAENESFVLAPQYTGEETDDVTTTVELIKQLVEDYSIDPSRIYLTGQSAGTIRAISMMIEYPDMFAGAMLVAGQADDAYTDRLAELADQNIWMIAATGDERALPGMTAIEEAVEAAGTDVTDGAWSAADSVEDQNAAAAEMAAAQTSIHFTTLSDVVPEGITDNEVTEHLNTWRVAYEITGIQNWLFEQTNA
ncbi:alpha/beta hydrolase-fold protein [Demequina soli]|uniref:alpha/beta hydrolase-fold protein n=1 Tax=Demequina soli TaxID=1638987 RepID=UPI0007825E69|nr:PHB depolymerase family esterase [Demequina soli]